VSTELGVAVAVAGQLVTAFALAYAISAPLLAAALGRCERRTLLVGALGTAALGNALSALAPTYPLLVAARVLTALGAAAYMPAATVVATQLSPPARRGRAVAAVFGGLTLSLVVGVPVGSLLAGPLGYRGVFALVAGVCLLGAIGVRLLLPRVAPPLVLGLRARLAVAADRGVLTMLGISVLMLIAVMSVYTYVAPLLAATAGVSGGVLSALLVGYGLGTLIGNYVGGILADRFGSLRPLAVVLPLWALVIATLPLSATTAVSAGIVLLLLGAGWTVNPPIQSRLIELAQAGSAQALSLNASAIYLGAGLAGVVGGIVIDTIGVRLLPPVAALFMVGSVGLLLLARRQRPASPTEPTGSAS
jgi:predicted MFS family arabinose efflux permease